MATEKVNEVLTLMTTDRYEPKMWEKVFALNGHELKELSDIGKQIPRIIRYVETDGKEW